MLDTNGQTQPMARLSHCDIPQREKEDRDQREELHGFS